MIKVGITGGIGSGKSIVSEIFSRLGIPVYNADTRAKFLMQNSAKIKQQLQGKFGPEVFINNQLNRKFLADIIFHEQEALSFVNSVVHPEVAADFQHWSENYSKMPYTIEEAALLFESGAFQKMDHIIMVYAPLSIRLKRVMDRDRATREQVISRMENQMSEEEKIKRSRYIIYNDEKNSVLEQVLTLHSLFNRN